MQKLIYKKVNTDDNGERWHKIFYSPDDKNLRAVFDADNFNKSKSFGKKIIADDKRLDKEIKNAQKWLNKKEADFISTKKRIKK